MASKTATISQHGPATQELCRRMVEEWLNRDLRRLMSIDPLALDRDRSARKKEHKTTSF